MSAPPPPPEYRVEDSPDKHCGNCHMFYEGRCWGFGNTPVEEDHVCNNWAPEPDANARGGHLMEDHQTPEGDVEPREKYSQADRDKMAGKEAMPDGSYPIADAEDLSNAIRAVGRGSNNSHNAIRKHIMARAKALGLSSKIPDNWNSDGSLEEQNGADPALEYRRERAARLEGVNETRKFAASDVEVRETSDGSLRFTGYASITERAYEVGDFEETIARGAFKRTLSESPDVVLLLNHDGLPLARTKSGTLTLSEDARGLRVDADLNPNDPDVQRVRPKLERGDVDEMSFAFRATDQEWNEDYSQRLIRGVTIHKGDVSIVTYGANDASTGGLVGLMRAAESALMEARAGKTLSAKSRSEIEGAITNLQALLDGSDKVETDPTPVEVAQEALEATESTPEAPQPVIIDRAKRQRERERLLRLREARR